MAYCSSYYLYQKYEKRGDQDWIPSYPNVYSIDGEGSKPLRARQMYDTDCGWIPDTDVQYRTLSGTPYCSGETGYDKYVNETYQVSYDSGITWSTTGNADVLVERNSPDCGYVPPIEPIYRWTVITPTSDPSTYYCDECQITPIYRWANSGTTCVNCDKYQRTIKQVSYDNGSTWENVSPAEYSATTLIEANSYDCGYRTRTTSGTPYCSGYNKYVEVYSQVSYDSGSTWSTTATTIALAEPCSDDCMESVPYANQYLTFVPLEECTFSADVMTAWYSDDCGETWNALYQSQTVTTDKKILIKSGSEQLGPPSYTPTAFPRFSSTGRFNVQGNIMSLAYRDNFLNKTSMPSGYCFDGTFMGCNKLVNAEHLVLPLTALTDYCYDEMFYGCTSLVTTPELPATSLSGSNSCYANMFRGCTSLTTLPNISATTLGNSCYESMFQGCTSLTSVPSNYLPLTSLNGATQCYRGMFRGCTNLTTVPLLPSSALTYYCYANMFEGCASLTGVPSNLFADAALSEGCYYCMFKGCTALTESPDLNATGISTYGYGGMFDGCTSLSAVTCLATNISASNCTNDWLNNVSPTGVFYKAESMTGWTRGESGIPSGWTVYPNEEWVNSGTTCVGYDKYYSQVKIINYSPSVWSATTDTRVGSLIEVNSEDCGYVPPAPPSGDTTQYLTFEAVEDTKFAVTSDTFIQYSFDLVNWTTLSSGEQTPTVPVGDKIMWKSTASSYTGNGIGHFSSTGRFNVEGNIMSLFYGDSASGQTSLSGKTSAFKNLFKGCWWLVNAENLVLPATTLENNCYEAMFSGCTRLTAAPELPATTLKKGCYKQMFNGCSSLTTAPDLSASTSVNDCYYEMFQGCSSLNYIKCLMTSPAGYYGNTDDWVYGVASSGTFVKAPNHTWNITGSSGIPRGWTVQNAT